MKQSSHPARRLPVWKKLCFSAAACMLFFAIVEVLLALAQFEPGLRSRDPYVGFESSIPLFVERTGEDGQAMLATAENKLAYFNEQRFPKQKPPGAYRIFCLGGSTTYGRPYDDATSFPGWLRELLPAADPSRDWEVINAGGVSYASYRVAALMEELADYQPDLFIVYSGHNEFLEERTYRDLKESSAAVRRVDAILGRTRTYSALASLLRPIADDDRHVLPGEVDAVLDHSVGPADYHRDEPLREQILEHYRMNLARMVGIARAAGAEVLLVVPASNVKDCSPFKSEHREDIDAGRLAEWERLYERGLALQSAGNPQEALEAYQRAAEIDDRYADLHYRIGQALFDLNRLAEARTALDRAVEEDICPLRALPRISEIVRQTAEQSSAPLVDAELLLRNECLRSYGHNAPGREYFLDHVHPTIAANGLLAVAIIERLAESGVVEQQSGWNDAAIDEVAARIEASLDPQAQSTALLNLAKVLNWAGKHDEAGPLAVEAVELRARNGLPPIAEALVLAAAHLNSRGNVDAAIAHYRQALRLRPDYVEAHQLLGAALTSRGRFEEAHEHFVAVTRYQPDDAHAHHMAGAVLAEVGRFDEAIEHYRRALRFAPNDANIHFNMAFALDESGNRSEAMRWYRKTLELNPDDAEAKRRLQELTEGPR